MVHIESNRLPAGYPDLTGEIHRLQLGRTAEGLPPGIRKLLSSQGAFIFRGKRQKDGDIVRTAHEVSYGAALGGVSVLAFGAVRKPRARMKRKTGIKM